MKCIYRGVVIVERLLDRLSMSDQHVASGCPDQCFHYGDQSKHCLWLVDQIAVGCW